MRALVAKLRIAENEDQNKATALNSTQEQLSYITEQQSHTSLQLGELEVLNLTTILCYQVFNLDHCIHCSPYLLKIVNLNIDIVL